MAIHGDVGCADTGIGGPCGEIDAPGTLPGDAELIPKKGPFVARLSEWGDCCLAAAFDAVAAVDEVADEDAPIADERVRKSDVRGENTIVSV